VARSIEAAEEELTMTDAEKFEGLKKELIERMKPITEKRYASAMEKIL
jgi:hypothetical protein